MTRPSQKPLRTLKKDSPKDPHHKDIPRLLAYFEREKRLGRMFVKCDAEEMTPDEAISRLEELHPRLR